MRSESLVQNRFGIFEGRFYLGCNQDGYFGRGRKEKITQENLDSEALAVNGCLSPKGRQLYIPELDMGHQDGKHLRLCCCLQ